MCCSIVERYHFRKCFNIWLGSFSNRMLDLLLSDYRAKRMLRTHFNSWRRRTCQSVAYLGTGESRCIRLRSRWQERHLLYFTSIMRSRALGRYLHACRMLRAEPIHDVQLAIYTFTIWRIAGAHQRLTRYKHLIRRVLMAWNFHVMRLVSLNRYRLLLLSKSAYHLLSRALSIWCHQALILERIALIKRKWLSSSLWKFFIHWRIATLNP